MTNDTELQQLVSETKFIDPNYQFFKDNLTKEKQTSLRWIQKNGAVIWSKVII